MNEMKSPAMHYSSLLDPRLAANLLAGKVGVLPTDTVYGLVALAEDQKAVSELYSLKNREHKPGTLIAADIEQLVKLGLKRPYLERAERFWPGPTTVVVPTENTSFSYLDQGLGSLAVRVIDDLTLQVLLKETGPLISTSANLPGRPVATTIGESQQYFGEQLDFYVDGGDLSGREASTVIKLAETRLRS